MGSIHDDAGGDRPHDRSALRWTLLIGATVVLGAWSRLRVVGTPEADAIEYLERAQGLVRAQPLIDAQAIRSIGVSLLHAPYLLAADLVGLHHGTWVLALSSLVHLAVTCLLVVGTVRFTSRLAGGDGATEGWFAGALCLASPSLLQYAAIPMADVAAGAAVAFGLVPALLDPPTGRSARRAGLLLGLAVLASFKAIPLLVLGLAAGTALALLRGGFVRAAGWLGHALIPVTALALVQALSDWLTYGSFGAGIWSYLKLNLGQRLAFFLYSSGLENAARTVYEFIGGWKTEELTTTQAEIDALGRDDGVLDGLAWFLPLALAPVAALGLAAGALRAWAGEASGRTRLAAVGALLAPFAIAAVYADATLVKGSRAMRIWLPILPIAAAFAGIGLATVAGRGTGPRARPRAGLAALAAAAAIAMGVTTLTAWRPWNNAAFARAARWLDELESPERSAPLRVACSYHWSFLFRTPSDWELVKLPHQLDGLGAVDEAGKEETWQALRELDAIALHWQLLRAETSWAAKLVDLVEEDFELVAAFWDRDVGMGFGPVMLFARPEFAPEVDRTLWRETAGASSGDPSGPRFERWIGERHEVVELVGARVERLPGDGLHWVELDLERHGPLIADYLLHLDVTAPDGSGGATELKRLGWGKRRFPDLPEGALVTEGTLLDPAAGPMPGARNRAEPAAVEGPFALWFDLATVAGPERTGRLELMDPGRGDHAERDDLVSGTDASDDGYRFLSGSGGVLLGTVDPSESGAGLRAAGPLERR
ncbi:MAG: hypothetical protein VXW31_10340 [Planctomycetota bacterium]|nr:hypothetical protein [Planctomycetota bacterium]